MQQNPHGFAAHHDNYGGDRISQKHTRPDSRLHQEAANLLTSPYSLAAFLSRISPCDTGAQNGANADVHQISKMIEVNPIPELLDAMIKQDPGRAVEIAIKNPERPVQPLCDTGDETAQEEVKPPFTGEA